MMERGTVRIM